MNDYKVPLHIGMFDSSVYLQDMSIHLKGEDVHGLIKQKEYV